MTKTWAQVSYAVPEAMVDDFSEFLLEFSPDGIITENLTLDTFSIESLEEPTMRTVTAFFEADDTLEEKTTLVGLYLDKTGAEYPGYKSGEPNVTYIKEEDWSNNWKTHFKPARIGKRLVVKPTWEEYPHTPSDIILVLDPGMAFGTGSHSTTRLCMEVLEKIFFREGAYVDAGPASPGHILDVGTGSGILAITAAKLGANHVTAIDIDSQAVTVAMDNIIMNGCENSVSVSDTPISLVEGVYDIVVANILAEELVKMAGELTGKVRPGGYLILSGILTEKEELVVRGFSIPGITLTEISRDAEWSCLAYRMGK
jgi:ribosomal protein L11 methyltransferase